MRHFFKLLTLFIVLAGLVGEVSAKNIIRFENPLSSVVKKSDISKSALVAVSFKEVQTGKKVYQFNANMPMTPASVQKIVTLLPSVDTLGKDYEFKTQLYKDAKNNLYFKLSADPYFTNADLKSMVREISANKLYAPKGFYIDDSIVDNNEWGEGWQWDDDLNPLSAKFSAYNIDRNLLTINIVPTKTGAPAEISTDVFYPTAFINNVVTSDKTDVQLVRKNYISPDVINADGTVSHDYSMQVPVNYPRRYFVLRLEDLLRKQKISYYGDFTRLKLPKDTRMIAEVKHPLTLAINDILKKSDNMVAETVFKVAGGKYAKETGNSVASAEMLQNYYKKMGIKTDNVKIVDGSGLSKNNLVTADFITEILSKNDKNPQFCIQDYMASPGEGTLTDRMLYFKGSLKAKTGTLTNISSIAGYLKTKSGKNYAFCIIVNDPKSKSADKKTFEEYVLRKAYYEL